MVTARRRKVYYKSPLGWLKIEGNGSEILAIDFVPKAGRSGPSDALLRQTVRQLREYFAGRRNHFSLRLEFTGTAFQRKVWVELGKIGCGRTRSYAEIASRIGRPNAVRAAGSAIGKNPIAIVVPCHRVIASNGGIAGYAGGIRKKMWLLAHESRRGHAERQQKAL